MWGVRYKHSAGGVAGLGIVDQTRRVQDVTGNTVSIPILPAASSARTYSAVPFPLYNPADACHFHAIFTTSGPVYGTGTGRNPIVPVRLVLVPLALFWRQPDRPSYR